LDLRTQVWIDDVVPNRLLAYVLIDLKLLDLRLQRYVLVKVLARLKRSNVVTFERSDLTRAFTPEA